MTAPEFSRPLRVESLPAKGERRIEITATPSECAALAARFALDGLAGLSARLELRQLAEGKTVGLSGRLIAEVTQSCVVTLDPVITRFDHEFAMRFAPVEEGDAEEIVVDLDEADPPEPIVDGTIDLGEAIAQELAGLIDPFPRAPDASLPELDAEAAPAGSFAALERWKSR